MRLRVRVQTDGGRKHFVTLATLERFQIAQVDLLLVRNHVAITTERLAAHVAVVVLDASVRDHVPGQIAGRDETFAANWTQLIADAGVDLFVCLTTKYRLI